MDLHSQQRPRLRLSLLRPLRSAVLVASLAASSTACNDEDAESAQDAGFATPTDGSMPGIDGSEGDAGPASDMDASRDAAMTGSDANVDDADTTPSDGGTTPDGATPADDASADEGGVSSGPKRRVIVASGSNHLLMLSIDDGETWCEANYDPSLRNLPGGESVDNVHLLRHVDYYNGWFVSGSREAVWRSRNGYAWANTTPDGPITREWIAQIAYGNGVWVAVGGSGTAMVSSDLVSWENVSNGLTGFDAARSLAFGNGLFVTSRDGGTWWESTDGRSWQTRSGSGEEVVFDGAQFIEPNDADQICEGSLCVRVNWGPNNTGGLTTTGGDGTHQNATPDTPWDVAFGEAYEADFASGASIPPAIKSCLGL